MNLSFQLNHFRFLMFLVSILPLNGCSPGLLKKNTRNRRPGVAFEVFLSQSASGKLKSMSYHNFPAGETSRQFTHFLFGR